jgi:hypothetical protein
MVLACKKIVFMCLLLGVGTLSAQRLFFGLGMPYQAYHHASTDKYYVLPASSGYDVYVIKKKQSEFVMGYPTINFLMGLEYGRWRFTTEPTVQPMNFPYRVYYPTGNGLVRTQTSGLDREDYHTGIVGFSLPVLAHYAVWNSRYKDQNLFLQTGASYYQNFTKDNFRNIYHQKTYAWAIGGLSYQTGGMYRSNFYLRYNLLLNPNNVAGMKIGTVVVGWAAHLPSIQVQRKKLFSDD